MATWLNHHHLQYFRQIAQEGGISAASRKVGITHSTLSAQLKQLEGVLGGALFDRKGRKMVLTPFGEQVLTYAEAIHRLGAQLIDFSEGVQAPEHRRPFRVAATATLPRTIVYRLMESVLQGASWGPVEIRFRPASQLLTELTSGRAHLGLTDEPVVRPGVHAHLLGVDGLHWYATPALAHRFGDGFPHSLTGAPLVLPAAHLPLRGLIDRWLVDQGIKGTRIAATSDDTAMLRVLGGRGVGLFPVRDALRAEVEDLKLAVPVGPIEGATERYYALSVERKIRDEGIALVVREARARFAELKRAR